MGKVFYFRLLSEYSMKNTDINEVRSMAIAFAHIPVGQDETMPLLASHPFTDSSDS